MGLAPFGWIFIARQRTWGGVIKVLASITAIVPLGMAAVALSVIINGALDALGLK
jgi:hypothetical protein